MPIKKKTESVGAIKRKSKFVSVYQHGKEPVEGLWQGKTNFAWARAKTGVYIIKENGKIVYIGAGRNVYKCALRHFEPHRGELYENGRGNKQRYYEKLVKNDYTMRIVLTNTPRQAFLLEAALIRKHQPRDNYIMPDLDLNFDKTANNIVEEYDYSAPF